MLAYPEVGLTRRRDAAMILPGETEVGTIDREGRDPVPTEFRGFFTAGSIRIEWRSDQRQVSCRDMASVISRLELLSTCR
jgi:hypothetical protein